VTTTSHLQRTPTPPTGRTAHDWRQLQLITAQPVQVDNVLIELAPLLHATGQTGPGCWWIRKDDTVRLRLWHPDPNDIDRISNAARQYGAQLHPGIYEPETHGFGGEVGIDVAHRLACRDSHHLAGHLARHRRHPHRNEIFLLLAIRLIRAAGLDLEEQGDVWARIAAHRPPPDTTAAAARRAVRHLIFSGPDTPTSPLHHARGWSDAVETAGRDLARLAATGGLSRGLRAVITNLLLFMANRHGIAARPLATMSAAAQHVIFQEDHRMAPPTKTPTDTLDPSALRDRLADTIRARGGFSSPDSPVERAFRTVFRHQFVLGTPLEEAYAPRPVVTKRDSDGSALSSASAPTLVARMLGQLAAQPGERILEIGAATGFNAALLAELVGPHGHVVTIEYDRDLTEGALDAITRTGYTDRVEVRCGDGALGAADRAPFDGIIVTVGAVTIPDAWWDQLTPVGRMIVPLRLHPSGLTRSLRLHRTSSDTAVSTQQLVCGFVPMRGQSAAVATRTRLADDILLDHAPTDIDHTTGLADALTSEPSWQHWTGLTIDATFDSVLHLDLWLATQQPIPFGRLSVSHEVREAGIADPSLRWSGAALFRDGSLAYLTTRASADAEEIGIAAHGPASAHLGNELGELTRTWHAGPRLREPTITITRDSTGATCAAIGWR
jgi:protein-L-isoaspartate(D-aspartate) O-methyltransferase